MIAAGDLQEFVPRGREHCRRHPGAHNLQPRELQPASELCSSDGAAGLVGSLREVTIHERQRESWQLRKGVSDFGEEVDYDEELYVASNVVIWSKGSKSEASAAYKAFSVDSPVLQVANIWPTKFGLLLERSSSSHEVPTSPPRSTTSLAGVFGSARVQYVADYTLRIVFVNAEPSIVMTYDTVQSLHTVWALRRVKPEEQNTVLKFSEQLGTPQNMAASSSLTAQLRSLSKGDSPMASPFQNYSSIHSQSRSVSSPSMQSRSPSISNMAALREKNSQASKVFITTDLCGQKFLCFLVESQLQLRCVKFQESNDKSQLIFGSVTNIQAKDAVPVQGVDTLLVLEGSGNLVLYSGVVRELSSNTMVRITIPEIATSELVKTCLQGVKAILPKEIAVQMLVKWYNAYNAPGGPSYRLEWNLFVTCLMNMMGYNTEKLTWTRNLNVGGSPSPVSAPKKARPSETGSDEDWEYLLSSDYHRNFETHPLSSVLGLDPLEVLAPKDDFLQSLSLDYSTLLFTHIPAIFFVLHLVYEEFKLNLLMGEENRSLVVLLIQLARDLKLEAYIDYYYRDYPALVKISGQTCIIDQDFTLRDLETLPFGVALPIRDAIYYCREQPASDWPEAVCVLIGRQDLSKQACEGNLLKSKSSMGPVLSSDSPSAAESEEDEDGMNNMNDEVMSLIWSKDLRVQEVRRLLQSARPVRVNVVQMPEASDHDFIEEKENRLLQLCQRTMALPVGRGMFTLFSYHPIPAEQLPIPKLNLTGRAPPRNSTVDLNSGNIDVPPNMACWASFHNGVAAGLKIAPASRIDSSWIIYNKPKNAEQANEYAGFLMALGLSGHLTKLATLNIHDYLTKGHEMTSIGLLLGVSAAKLGTMDMAITRLLSIHIPALLPPTSTELDVPHNVQVAAVIGIGLVYQGTAHRHTAEVLLAEIGRPPGPEMEYCTDRESYSLASGLALGMVCLGHGSNLIGMSDLNVPEQLYQYMVGGHRRFQAGMHREKHKSPSYQIKEGDTINVDVTCPGATLAFAMIYLKTNNRSIADWLQAPDTMYLLDFVKPEFLLLRTLARCLILWDDIMPSSEWVDSNVPQIIRENSIPLHATELPSSEDLSLETLMQAHVYIIAGACLSLGFRFAGSENKAAFNCLDKYATDFLKSLSAPTASIIGHYNLETCLSVLLLSLAMVVAGSGNLKVLQLCRFMHKKTGGEMNYGFHLAHHMALGLLFLGGGRYSLSTSNSSIAALLCALYPHFPVHSTDNRYHLQALRHLYVLAADPRLLIPVDVDSNTPCYALIEVTFKPEDISAFTSDPALLLFAEYFCKPTVNMGQAVRRLERGEMSETFELGQIKLVLEFFNSRCHQGRTSRNPNRGLFMNSEFLPVMKCTIDKALDQWLQGITNFSEMLLKFKQWNVLVRALLRLAPVLLKNPQSMVL
ncbi:hypothetical protein ASZ78_012608 [Callipepla squamata]|uniref:Anaphase-promoting complex subunit 1 n=1 Tax=Callipepla squamata TaxID=9009 RepID=A0A226MFU7_CALSU|nr:hypothetical protein ASZ78_012608 [Callipepla squamata]